MALNEKGKNRLRRVIRTTMVAVAVFLLLVALVIPVANNAVALGIERELQAIPVPSRTELVESISASGRYTDRMQYFGAILLKSELPIEEIAAHYPECGVDYQLDTPILAAGKSGDGEAHLAFSTSVEGAGYYIVYRWGSAPAWLRGILEMDVR